MSENEKINAPLDNGNFGCGVFILLLPLIAIAFSIASMGADIHEIALHLGAATEISP